MREEQELKGAIAEYLVGMVPEDKKSNENFILAARRALLKELQILRSAGAEASGIQHHLIETVKK